MTNLNSPYADRVEAARKHAEMLEYRAGMTRCAAEVIAAATWNVKIPDLPKREVNENDKPKQPVR